MAHESAKTLLPWEQTLVMNEATLFAAALERTTDAERAAFLADACGGNEPLRRRVEALLRAHAGSDDILDPTGDPRNGSGAATREAPGMVIGPYKLIEQTG